jgi:hypothetical protein
MASIAREHPQAGFLPQGETQPFHPAQQATLTVTNFRERRKKPESYPSESPASPFFMDMS